MGCSNSKGEVVPVEVGRAKARPPSGDHHHHDDRSSRASDSDATAQDSYGHRSTRATSGAGSNGGKSGHYSRHRNKSIYGGKSMRGGGGGGGEKSMRSGRNDKPLKAFEDKSVRDARGPSTRDTRAPSTRNARGPSTGRYSERTPGRLEPAPSSPEALSRESTGGKSRFARSVKAVSDAMFGQPPEWILRQTAPIKAEYQFLGVVGRGQFGQVYCIRQLRQNQKFACKTLGKKKLLSELDAEDIKREIEVMHHLTGHTLVVSLHRVYEDDKNVHLVMDLCQGDLYELLRERKYLTEEQAAPVMMLAIKAVQYLHSMGVVHRDIKPENFLLTHKDNLGCIKLTDFGLSTFFQEGQVFSELLGSPYYIAPEVIKQAYGKEVDVWSCGVMLYIMLCGEAPFFGDGDEGIFKSIMKAKLDFSFDPWPTLSRDVKMLLRRMLVKDPRQRATLEEVLGHAWFAKCQPPDISIRDACAGVVGRTGGPPGLPPLPQGPGRPASLIGSENTLFARLKRYSVASRVKKMALRYIVANLPDEVTAGLYNLFQEFDSDHNDAIDPAELQAGFAARGVPLLDEEASSLVNAADMDGDGLLNLVEWLGATISLADGQVDPYVYEAFQFFDVDQDGFLSMDELLAYLGDSYYHLAEQIMAEADADCDGQLSWDEFRAAYSMTLDCSRAASRPNTAGGPPANLRIMSFTSIASAGDELCRLSANSQYAASGGGSVAASPTRDTYGFGVYA